MRFQRALCVGWIVTALAAMGCAGIQSVGRLRTPQEKRLYVPVFVDETQNGEAGVTLRDALRHEIFVRDPERYCASFERDCWAFDGTVVSLRIESATPHKKKAVMQTHIRLVGHSATLELGDVQTEHIFHAASPVESNTCCEISLAKKAARDILRRMEKVAKSGAPEHTLRADELRPEKENR